jgi:hypothetical protein
MKVHLAVAVADIEKSVAEYTRLLGSLPVHVVPGEYALWRTEVLNFSIRRVEGEVGRVRHVGFERDDAMSFQEYRDLNGLVWETFSKEEQAREILATWPDEPYVPS